MNGDDGPLRRLAQNLDRKRRDPYRDRNRLGPQPAIHSGLTPSFTILGDPFDSQLLRGLNRGGPRVDESPGLIEQFSPVDFFLLDYELSSAI